MSHGIFASIDSIRLTSAEIAALHAAGQDGQGIAQSATHKAAELTAILQTLVVSLPPGANKSTLQAQLALLMPAI